MGKFSVSVPDGLVNDARFITGNDSISLVVQEALRFYVDQNFWDAIDRQSQESFS